MSGVVCRVSGCDLRVSGCDLRVCGGVLWVIKIYNIDWRNPKLLAKGLYKASGGCITGVLGCL